MLLAPLAVLPLGLMVGLIGWAGRQVGLPVYVVALLAIGALATGSRALHWDGLSDVVDGLTASYDPARSLAVMKSGTSGPAGVVAVVIVLGLQVAAFAPLLLTTRGVVLAGFLVCASRAALTITCLSGVPAARTDGLGSPHASSVSLPVALAVWGVLLAVTGGLGAWTGLPWWRGSLAVLLAGLVVALLVRRTLRRFGGVTGDVYGAAIELSLATVLVALS